MTWGLVLVAVAIFIGWRRSRVDVFAVTSMLIAIALVLAYTYRSLGG